MSTATVRDENEARHTFELLGSVEQEIAASTLDQRLCHLVKLRASQINGCASCVKMHTTEARRDGETIERLERLVVWDEVSDYSAAEKAALAWTEALTSLDHRVDRTALRRALRLHFTEGEITALTTQIAMINVWNRFQVSRH